MTQPRATDPSAYDGFGGGPGTGFTPERPVGAPRSSSKVARSRHDRMLAGVAGGVADATGLDPALVRIGFVAVGVMSAFWAVVAYVAAWVMLPVQPYDARPVVRQPRAKLSAAVIVGTILVALGVSGLIGSLAPIHFLSHLVVPVAAIVVGAVLVKRGRCQD